MIDGVNNNEPVMKLTQQRDEIEKAIDEERMRLNSSKTEA